MFVTLTFEHEIAKVCRAHAGERQRQAHHIGRSYAVQSSPLRRLDYRPYPQRCRPHWAGNHCSVRVHSGAQAASRAGLPILPRPSFPHTTASASMPPPLSGWLRDFFAKSKWSERMCHGKRPGLGRVRPIGHRITDHDRSEQGRVERPTGPANSAGKLSRSKMVGAVVEATTLSAFGAE